MGPFEDQTPPTAVPSTAPTTSPTNVNITSSKTVAPTVDCTDDEDFKYKGSKKKNFDWVGSGRYKRRIKKKCKKKYDNRMVYEWCPYTCGKVKVGNCIT